MKRGKCVTVRRINCRDSRDIHVGTENKDRWPLTEAHSTSQAVPDSTHDSLWGLVKARHDVHDRDQDEDGSMVFVSRGTLALHLPSWVRVHTLVLALN
jgi:hypothetical protein